MTFPTRPSIRSPLAPQPKADRSFWFGGGGRVRPLSSPANRNAEKRRNGVFNVYENHEDHMRSGVAPGGILAGPRRSEDPVGYRGLCGCHDGRHPGGHQTEVSLGYRVCCHRRAFQSRPACSAFSQDVSLAGLGLPHDVSGLAGCIEEATDTFDSIHHQSNSGKRVIVRLQAWYFSGQTSCGSAPSPRSC